MDNASFGMCATIFSLLNRVVLYSAPNGELGASLKSFCEALFSEIMLAFPNAEAISGNVTADLINARLGDMFVFEPGLARIKWIYRINNNQTARPVFISYLTQTNTAAYQRVLILAKEETEEVEMVESAHIHLEE